MKRYIFKNLIVFTLALLGGNAHADLDDAYTISAYPTLNFFYPADGPILTCNDEEKPNKIPTACTFVDKGGQGQLDLTLTTWDGQHALLTSKDGVISITGSCRNSVTKDLQPNAYQLDPTCRPNEGAVTFFFDSQSGKNVLTCNEGEPMATSPAICRLDNQGVVELTLTNWGGPTAVLRGCE